MRHWLMADGDDGDQWDEFYRDGVVRITGRQRLGDLRQYGSRDEIVEALKDKYKEEFKTKNPATKATLCFNFGHEVKVGDGMFARHRRQTVLGYGIVEPTRKRATNSGSSPAYFFDRNHPRYPHAIRVRWLKQGTFPVKDYLLPMNFIAEVRNGHLAALKKALGTTTAAKNGFRNETEQAEALEGRILIKEARFRVQNRNLISQKKAGCDYCCEICGFNFEQVYGEIGRNFIIAHHIETLASRRRSSVTRSEDIILICSNCHCIVHKTNPPISPAVLRRLAPVRRFRHSVLNA